MRPGAGSITVGLATIAFLFQDTVPGRVRAMMGVCSFIALLVACSSNVRAINWRTVGWGLGLQVALALFILKFEVGGSYARLSTLCGACKRHDEVSSIYERRLGIRLRRPGQSRGNGAEEMGRLFPNGFVLAFAALPIIVFVSSVFTVLYYLGVLQMAVKLVAKAMMPLMGTSGAETLSAVANVFMGQTEAPIIVRPYIPQMTQSELLTLMTGGLATIAGSVLGVYISLGADPVAILTTSVMAAPCGLYLSKILLPETKKPVTAGRVSVAVGRGHANIIDAAAGGAVDGMRLAINVAAMLIAFLAFIAMIDYLLGLASSGLSMARIFAVVFAPVAALIGVSSTDVPALADLLGTKLVTNEFVAYIKLGSEYKGVISLRSHALATYALTGFANFGSVGILLGGIGSMAPERRTDLARLSTRALLAGFLATLINASIVPCYCSPVPECT